jgi:hypothetical protein
MSIAHTVTYTTADSDGNRWENSTIIVRDRPITYKGAARIIKRDQMHRGCDLVVVRIERATWCGR